MSSFGRTVVGSTGGPITVLADGRTDGMKAVGVTVDWSTVTAVEEDTTVGDGTIVKAGDKFIRYGTVLSTIDASGKYGPAKTNAEDGREDLTRGASYILNQTVVMSHLGSDHPPVFDAGLAYLARIVTNESVSGANNPTQANVLAAFPAVRLVRD